MVFSSVLVLSKGVCRHVWVFGLGFFVWGSQWECVVDGCVLNCDFGGMCGFAG